MTSARRRVAASACAEPPASGRYLFRDDVNGTSAALPPLPPRRVCSTCNRTLCTRSPVRLARSGLRPSFFLSSPIELAVLEVLLAIASRAGGRRDAFLDVGMNNGFYTSVMAAFPVERVVSFEVQPACLKGVAAQLLASEGLAPVHLNLVALGDDDARKTRSKRTGCNGGHTALPQRADSAADAAPPSAASLVLDVRRLDSILPRGCGRRVAAAKIDTEGAEVLVLTGMQRLLGRDGVSDVVVEVSPQWWAAYGLSVADGAAFFQTLHERRGARSYVLYDEHEAALGGRVSGTSRVPHPLLERAACRDARVGQPLRQIHHWRPFVEERVKLQGGCNVWLTFGGGAGRGARPEYSDSWLA